MDTSSANLAVLQSLPDPNLQLYDQHLTATWLGSFSELPAEVRIRIWELSFSRRQVHMIPKSPRRSDHIRRKQPSIETLRCARQQPAAFCVNAESRAVALENHVKIADDANAPNSGATYVHKELDRLVIYMGTTSSMLTDEYNLASPGPALRDLLPKFKRVELVFES
ncbi:uncharacterized protein LY89DRAFT_674146 [Mollisia scopiformis]|uniref:2EXR domain-containing protein n=1 Tax=Mollisia scopiformis TaxID=149040 RepID=A0A194WVE6_MOLSC|nr:uncharacterized protein LY89DRAFT_674146 [Mollisia scopiformis]KUJ11567.1 hypothetical protein LY89DRAFT_674146 [Mollisia scopiformis]